MSHNRKLLVEGEDDRHVIWGLLEANSFPETFIVEQKGGVDNLLKTFPVQAKGSGVEAVGVVLDADMNLATRWRSLSDILSSLGYNTPQNFPEDGLILTKAEGPMVGAWIMPNNKIPGMLEDFVSYLVPAGDQLWEHANNSIEGIPDGAAGFAETHLSKARIHTWLAWQKDPGTPMGLAITKKYLRSSCETTEPFLNWLRRLFVP